MKRNVPLSRGILEGTSLFVGDASEPTLVRCGTIFLWTPRLSTAVNGRTEPPEETVGAGLRGGRLEGVAVRAGSVSLRPGGGTAEVRDRHAAAVSERILARRRRHGVRDDRHDRSRTTDARSRRALPVRPGPEWDQHRADGREEDGQAAPPLGPRGVHQGMPQGDRGDRQRHARARGPRRHVSGLRAHVLHGLRRIPSLQPGDLPRALAERTLLPRRAPDVLVSGLRDTARRGRYRLRGAALEPRVDEIPADIGRGDPDRDDATGAARGVPRGDRPSRGRAVRRPPREEGARAPVRPRGADPRTSGGQAGVRERGRDDLLVRRHGGPPAFPRTAARTREGDRGARQDDGRRGSVERAKSRNRPGEGDRASPGRRFPREARADSTQDADLLAHPEPDRVPLLRRVVPEAARVPGRPPPARCRDGVPADAAPAARPRLDRQPDNRLADLPSAVLPHGDPAVVLQAVRGDPRAASGEILPTMEGSRAVREMPEVQLQGVRRRGPGVRHLDGLERFEPVPHPVPDGPGLLRRELPPFASAARPGNRPDVALLHDAQVMARAEVEAVPPRVHPLPPPPYARAPDASHDWGRGRTLAADSETP